MLRWLGHETVPDVTAPTIEHEIPTITKPLSEKRAKLRDRLWDPQHLKLVSQQSSLYSSRDQASVAEMDWRQSKAIRQSQYPDQFLRINVVQMRSSLEEDQEEDNHVFNWPGKFKRNGKEYDYQKPDPTGLGYDDPKHWENIIQFYTDEAHGKLGEMATKRIDWRYLLLEIFLSLETWRNMHAFQQNETTFEKFDAELDYTIEDEEEYGENGIENKEISRETEVEDQEMTDDETYGSDPEREDIVQMDNLPTAAHGKYHASSEANDTINQTAKYTDGRDEGYDSPDTENNVQEPETTAEDVKVKHTEREVSEDTNRLLSEEEKPDISRYTVILDVLDEYVGFPFETQCMAVVAGELAEEPAEDSSEYSELPPLKLERSSTEPIMTTVKTDDDQQRSMPERLPPGLKHSVTEPIISVVRNDDDQQSSISEPRSPKPKRSRTEPVMNMVRNDDDQQKNLPEQPPPKPKSSDTEPFITTLEPVVRPKYRTIIDGDYA